MAHLNAQVLGRDLDAEGIAKILNVAQLTLSGAASAANEPMRKGEFDTAVGSLDTRLTAVEGSAMHLDAVHVDTTSPDLVTALSTGSFADGIWTFGGKQLSEGDLLILNAATEQDEARSWVLNGSATGTAADFTALASDIDAAIQEAVNSVVGTATNAFNTLGKAEAAYNALAVHVSDAENDIDILQSQMPLRPEFKAATAASWTDNGDGTHTASIVNPYNSTEVQVQVQTDAGSGTWEYVFSPAFDMDITNSAIEITTNSTTMAAHAVKFLMSGIVAIV